MGERLIWIENGFIDKALYAPYVVKKDIDYLGDLRGKYALFFQKAKNAGADQESLDIILEYTNSIEDAICAYYCGEISKTHVTIKRLIE